MKIKTYSKGEYNNIDINIIYSENIKTYNRLKEEEKFYSLVFIQSGKVSLKYRDTVYNLNGGEIVFVDEENKVEIKQDFESKIKIICFYPELINAKFSFKYLKSGLRNYNNFDELDTFLIKDFLEKDDNIKLIKLGIEASEKVEDLMEEIYEYLEQQENKYWVCRTRANLIELLYFLENSELKKENYNAYGELNIAEVKKYIKLNYNKAINLEILCKEFGTNKMTLSKKFKQMYKNTVINYLIEIRVDMSKKLLKETSLPILEIMERVGFSNVGNFYRQFKKIENTTPNEYRND